MNQQPEKDFNAATAVNNEDIKGLLKAAGLNEFYADVKSQDSNLKFEKSGSLFDLVRTNITGEKADIVSILSAVPRFLKKIKVTRVQSRRR